MECREDWFEGLCFLGRLRLVLGGFLLGGVLGQSFLESPSSLLLLLSLSAVSIRISSDGLFLGFVLFGDLGAGVETWCDAGGFAFVGETGFFGNVVFFLVGAGSFMVAGFVDGASADTGDSWATAFDVLGVGTGSFRGSLLFTSHLHPALFVWFLGWSRLLFFHFLG